MLIRPWRIVDDITTLDPKILKEHGIRGVIFDLDNTIMAPRTGALETHIEQWLAELQKQDLKLVVVSNNKKAHYVQAAEKVLNIPVIGNAGKPRRKYLRKGLEILGMKPDEVAVVGDRPLTDIWGGNRLGAFTILVDPLTKHSEHWFIKILRKLERAFIRTF